MGNEMGIKERRVGIKKSGTEHRERENVGRDL